MRKNPLLIGLCENLAPFGLQLNEIGCFSGASYETARLFMKVNAFKDVTPTLPVLQSWWPGLDVISTIPPQLVEE